jgi:hypothetical protein
MPEELETIIKSDDPNDPVPYKVSNSSFIAAVNYTAETEIFDIMFHGNPTIYSYYPVPLALVSQFKQGESLGRFYNEFIKGIYSSVKVLPE